MKKIVRWLAKVFDVNTVEIREVVKTEYVTSGVVNGDLYVDGNLLVEGTLTVKGGVAIYAKEV